MNNIIIELGPIESSKIKRKEIVITKDWFIKTEDVQNNNFNLEKKLAHEFNQFDEVSEKRLVLNSNNTKN